MSWVCTHYGDDLARFVVQAMGKLLIVGNQMGHVNVTVESLGQDIFPDLVSVYEGILDVEIQDEVDELFLDVGSRVFGDRVSVFWEHT